MKLLGNPVVVKMTLLFVLAASIFIVGVWMIRRLRKEMAGEVSASTPRVENAAAFAVATFESVIQQLKDKEEELKRLRQAAHDRASASENIAAAVFRYLDTGVVVFNAAGLAQQANPAAREILGYATVSGMHARDLFRGVSALRSHDGNSPDAISEALERTLRDASTFRCLQADYATPSGQQRSLSITVAPALGSGGERLGAVCLVGERRPPSK